MKHLFLLTVLAFAWSGHAQSPQLPIDETTQRVTYEAVVDVPGEADALYAKMEAWFKDYYNNPALVIQEKDDDLHKITGKHKFALQVKNKKGEDDKVGFVIYTIKTWVKDNKIRYMVTDIHLDYKVYQGVEDWLDPAHYDAERNAAKLQKVDEYIRALIANMTEYMLHEEVEVDEDEW